MTLANAIAKMPRFMHPDLSRVECFADLLFQVVHEIDLAEEDGGANADWTKRQVHTAKMYAANVRIWSFEVALNHVLQGGT